MNQQMQEKKNEYYLQKEEESKQAIAEYARMKKHKYKNRDGENSVGVILTIIAWLTFILGFISGIIFGVSTEGFVITLICWAGSFVSGMTFIGLAEIIKLLEELKNN